MHYTFDRQRLQVEINAKGCDVPADQRARMQETLQSVAEAVEPFPEARLWMNLMFHPNSKIYHAEAKLRLPGRTLFSGEHDPYLDTAFQRCAKRLRDQVEDYRKNPNNGAVGQAGRRVAQDQNLVMPRDPDAGPIAKAVQDGNYRAFRNGMIGYEDWIRKRVGRWIQRYPEAEARVDDEPLIGDLVEEVFLNAFERFTERPMDLRLSEWLDKLIDRSVQEYLRHPDQVHQEASLARTLRETDMD